MPLSLAELKELARYKQNIVWAANFTPSKVSVPEGYVEPVNCSDPNKIYFFVIGSAKIYTADLREYGQDWGCFTTRPASYPIEKW